MEKTVKGVADEEGAVGVAAGEAGEAGSEGKWGKMAADMLKVGNLKQQTRISEKTGKVNKQKLIFLKFTFYGIYVFIFFA